MPMDVNLTTFVIDTYCCSSKYRSYSEGCGGGADGVLTAVPSGGTVSDLAITHISGMLLQEAKQLLRLQIWPHNSCYCFGC